MAFKRVHQPSESQPRPCTPRVGWGCRRGFLRVSHKSRGLSASSGLLPGAGLALSAQQAQNK